MVIHLFLFYSSSKISRLRPVLKAIYLDVFFQLGWGVFRQVGGVGVGLRFPAIDLKKNTKVTALLSWKHSLSYLSRAQETILKDFSTS